MSFWTDARVRQTLQLSLEPRDLTFTSVGTDSRTIEKGALFVALRGQQFDGHAYLADVASKGARGAVVQDVPKDAPKSLAYYPVADTQQALGRLGRARRRALTARLCAVTGSNGKTTTKEMLRAVLGTRYRVHATTGNLNNLIGTPLTLLAAPDDAEVLVIELGTSLPGEIAQLAAMVEPDAAVVTGISEEHLEGLGDLQGVLKEETAILHALKANGFAVVADDPAVLADEARAVLRSDGSVHVAGWTARADDDLRATDVRLDEHGEVHFGWNDLSVHVPLRGRHNARNALIALG
ncbi:MAG TPA: UDP-N-acetylmuramoyl-tripeptide--D-alanyl-D-alanine ligase, partial [Longimicrobiales bacterium]|nr:UDP-N-acetylmuramoyl-tripeptide--D-alanyl-D-alanine ligase [Longimicrobiales bacterium]